MPYEVSFINENDRVKAHSLVSPTVRLFDTQVSQSVKEIDSFTFSILRNHPAYGFVQEMKTLVEIVDLDTGLVEFEGRVTSQTGKTEDAITESQYVAEDVIGLLHDSRQMQYHFKGTPSELFRFLINRHNKVMEPWKQFSIGVCELDTYETYGESEESVVVSVNLQEGDTATIKPTAKYIYDWDGAQLTMANYAKGVAHIITGIRTSNGNKQYQLSRTWPSGVTTVEGFVNETDIVEAQDMMNPNNVPEPGGELSPGTEFKIREGVTTYFGASDGGGVKTIPSEYRTFIYKVSSHGLYNGMYGMVYNGTVIAWIPSSDVVRVDGRDFDVITPPSQPQPPPKVDGRYPTGTKAKIKRGVTTYYASSDGSGAVTIPTKYRTLNYTVRDYSSKYKRYTIYDGSHGVAWVNEADLDFGQRPLPTGGLGSSSQGKVERIRKIEVDLTYSMSTYEAIRQFLLEPYGAEMYWTKVEEVRTLHIVKQRVNETDERIQASLNLISMQRDFNPSDVVTVLIPIGKPPKKEEEADGSN